MFSGQRSIPGNGLSRQPRDCRFEEKKTPLSDPCLNCPGCGSFLHSGRHRCAVSSYSTCSSSLIFISGVVAYQFGGIACWENRDVTKLMYEVCCNGRPGKLTHLRVQPLAPNAQHSLGHLPLAQKSKKPWAGLSWQGTGEIWEWSGTIVMSRSLGFWEPSLKHIPLKSSVVQWLGLARLKMQAPKTPKHEFRHDLQTQI